MAALNEEGGSHHAGVERRLSAGSMDINNQREKFVAKKIKPAADGAGCFGIMSTPTPVDEADVVLIGGGVMSTTVGLLLQQLQPGWKINMYERLHNVAEESSNGWNNAGTGHSALCEPNYTPDKDKGTPQHSVDISKAITVNENWQLSRQYWGYLAEKGMISNPNSFINVTPHMTFVHGEDQIKWCKFRFEQLSKHPLFKGMMYTEDKKLLTEWCPLMMEGRDPNEKVALTTVPYGTDCDFGELTRQMAKAFVNLGGNLQLYSTVTALKKESDGRWNLTVKKNDLGGGKTNVRAKFVFVGAGGWALPLLQKSGIPEIRGFMGFPISGQFLCCQNPEVVSKHPNKCYGKAAIGAPPMSVPHLDARIIGGKAMLLFGPFAGFSPRYLKTGSLLDLFKSVKWHNIIPAACAGMQNMDLTIYLIKQVAATKAKKLAELREFVPTAKAEDWIELTAGQRVQIMKKDPEKWGILQFGTEVISGADGSIAGLLGASPGASTAVQVALDVLRKCFTKDGTFARWEPQIKEYIPSFGTKLSDDPAYAMQIHNSTAKALNIK